MTRPRRRRTARAQRVDFLETLCRNIVGELEAQAKKGKPWRRVGQIRSALASKPDRREVVRCLRYLLQAGAVEVARDSQTGVREYRTLVTASPW